MHQSILEIAKKLNTQIVQYRPTFNGLSSSTSVIMYNNPFPEGEYYGGEAEIIASPERKKLYLKGLILSGLEQPRKGGGWYTLTASDKYLLDILIPGEPIEPDDEGGLGYPRAYEGGIDPHFYEWILGKLLDPLVSIHNGSRNGYYEHDDVDLETSDHTDYIYDLFNFLQTHRSTVKYHPHDGSFSIYLHDAGEVLRIGDSPLPYTSTPDLVDFKFTDYCTFGCAFCYQGSTPKGKNMDIAEIQEWFDVFEKLQVFEVALGGGEPTEHPQFRDILEQAQRRHFEISFTTRNYRWLLENSWVWNKVVGVGYSTENAWEFETLVRALGYNYREKIHVHVIPALLSATDFTKIIQVARNYSITPTLLGYKTTKRGATHKLPKTDYNLREVWQACGWSHFPALADTSFVQQHPEFFTDLPEYFWDVKEGQTALYVDGVKCEFGQHSFGAKLHKPDHDRPWTWEESIRKTYLGWNK